MKIILFGASGQTGKLFLQRALEKGNQVTAVVRDPSKININDDNLKVKIIDLFNEEELVAAITGNELVVSCLGGNANKKDCQLGNLITNIVNAMKKTDVKNIFHISSAGIHGEMPGIIAKIFVSLFFGNAQPRMLISFVISKLSDCHNTSPISNDEAFSSI